MTKKNEVLFSDQLLNLEIDFEDSGGIQRFSKVSDLEKWLNEEKEFWGWLQNIQRPQRDKIPDSVKDVFFRYHVQCEAKISAAKQQWADFSRNVNQLGEQSVDPNKSKEQIKDIQGKIEEQKLKQQNLVDPLRKALLSQLTTEILTNHHHITQNEPEAQFLKELSKNSPMEAAFALDQFLLEKQNSQEIRSNEPAGRMLATMFSHNLNRKVRSDQKAFRTASETWSRELSQFKERYEILEKKFQEVTGLHQESEISWAEKRQELEWEHSQMMQAQKQELLDLYAKYDGFMKLKGPREYWDDKKKEHSRGKILFGILVVVASGLGGYFLYTSAQTILPEAHDSSTVPWRNLGLFVLLSTFVLWGIRLLSKIFLSHVHLYIDAREREVMIATFLALLEREESKQSLTREDLAIVLAPIFRPSTTGVIRDEGGPMNILDFVGKLGGH